MWNISFLREKGAGFCGGERTRYVGNDGTVSRLQKMMQPPQNTVALPQKRRTQTTLGRKNENMLLAAIPFLDLEYQQGIYVMVRLD